jgi:hypothetical protein
MLFDTIYNFIVRFHNDANSRVATLNTKLISLKWYKDGNCLVIHDMDNCISVETITDIVKTLLASSHLRDLGLVRVRLDFIYNKEQLSAYEKNGWTIVDEYVQMSN